MTDYKKLRRYPRATVRPPVVARWRAAAKDDRGMVSNVSVGGCYLLTAKTVQSGEGIVITIDDPVLELECVVRYMDPEVGMGLEFIGLNPETKQQLDEFLQARAVHWK